MQTPTFGMRKLLVGHSVLAEKKARAEAVASIRVCVVANRQVEPISRTQILQYIVRLLSEIALGGFPAKDDRILPSTGQHINAVWFRDRQGKAFRGAGVRVQVLECNAPSPGPSRKGRGK